MTHDWIKRTKRTYRLNIFVWVRDLSGKKARLDVAVECTSFGLDKTAIVFDAEGVRGYILVAGDTWTKEQYDQVVFWVKQAYEDDLMNDRLGTSPECALQKRALATGVCSTCCPQWRPSETGKDCLWTR